MLLLQSESIYLGGKAVGWLEVFLLMLLIVMTMEPEVHDFG